MDSSRAVRLSRRAALAAAGGGIAALLATNRRAPTAAQDATPLATPAASPGASPAAGGPVALLFVQTFATGTWTPKPDTEGVYLLTVTGHTAQTVYFSDRPERLVGTLLTREFLQQLGFTPENPPNAAVVAQTADGGEDVLVVELFDPVYEEPVGADGGVSVTYRARVLAGEPGERLAAFAGRQGDALLPGAFGAGALFIDSSFDIWCILDPRPPC